MMVGVPQGLTYVSLKFGKVDAVVDTISRKAYCHHPLMSQEQPLSMRISYDLFKKLPLMVSLYNPEV
jgi:hypothetical protein